MDSHLLITLTLFLTEEEESYAYLFVIVTNNITVSVFKPSANSLMTSLILIFFAYACLKDVKQQLYQ